MIAGGGLERLVGGGKVADVPGSTIDRLTEGTVYLSVDREEIVGAEEGTRTG